MTEDFPAKLFEHNNWANMKIIQACSALSDEQLDAEPQSATKGSIRRTLLHLVSSQQGYLSLLTVPVEERYDAALEFAELQESAWMSGEGSLELVRNERKHPKTRLQTVDGFYVEPWVVMVQIINHATEHREQIKSMLSSLGGLLQILMVGIMERLEMLLFRYQRDRSQSYSKYHVTLRERLLRPALAPGTHLPRVQVPGSAGESLAFLM